MPFGNTITKMEETKETLTEKITQLGIDIENAKNLKKEYKTTEEDVAKIVKTLLGLSNEKEEKEKGLEVINDNIQKSNETLITLDSEIVIEKEKKEIVKKETEVLYETKAELITKIYLLNIKKDELDKTLEDGEGKKEELEKIKTDIVDNKKVFVELGEKIGKLNKDISEKTKKNFDLDIENKDKLKEIEVKNVEITNLETKKASLTIEQEELEKEYKTREEELQIKLQGIEESKREEWEKREGDTSLQVQWIEEKRETLRIAKDKVEKELGKKIDINI